MNAKTVKQKLIVALTFCTIQISILGILRHLYGIDKVSDFNMLALIEGVALIMLIDRILYRTKSNDTKKPKVIKKK